jgi:pimeloyl-ACP methyl ester carboxylesterase
MATFVLIHGAWHGGYAWRHVTPMLRKAGHEVFAPSLTGLGDRAHLSSREIDLDTHIQDVVSLLEMEDLHEVILLGHSYGGMVITGAADRVPQRIRRLIYFDAFVGENGKSCMDYVAAAVPERVKGFREQAKESGFVPPPPAALWGHTDPALIGWLKPREVRHPFASQTQPLRLNNEEALKRIPKTFVHCTSPGTGSFDQFAAKYRNAPGWRFFEVKSGHDAMLLKPRDVADVLLENVAE